MITFRFSYVTKEFADVLNDALMKSLANISGLVRDSGTKINSESPAENETVAVDEASPIQGTAEEFEFKEIINIGLDEENHVLVLNIGKSDNENDDLVIECSQLMSMEEEDAPQGSEEPPTLEEELEKEEQSIPEMPDSDTEVVSNVNKKIDQAMETGEVPSPESAGAEEAKPEDNHIS